MPVPAWVQKRHCSGGERTTGGGWSWSLVAGPDRDSEAAGNRSQTMRPNRLLLVLTTPWWQTIVEAVIRDLVKQQRRVRQ